MVARQYFAAHADFADERARLGLLEQENDPVTVQHLTRLGVAEGWRCLEVGAGAGSIARWLAEQVGPKGLVVATEVDTRFLDHLSGPNIVVRRHDIADDALEEDSYDLVHCRALLFHLRDPEASVAKMSRALRVGGWLLVEEGDLSSFGPVDDTCHVFAAGGAVRRMISFAETAGIWNPFIGRRLPLILAELGLVSCGNEVMTRILQGGEPMAVFAEKSYQRLDEVFLTNEVSTKDEIADRGRILADPNFWFVNHMMVSAWGRRPADGNAARRGGGGTR